MVGSFLKLGYNFTSDLRDYIIKKNAVSTKNTISEVYGSRAESSFLSARPKCLLPDLSRNEFRRHVRILSNYGISFNYTLNASSIGSKEEIISCSKAILDYISFLIDCGVDTITVSIPIMAEFIRSISSEVKIEVSTIAHIDTVSQAKIWRDTYKINKICGNLHKNRDITFLESLNDYCIKNDIILSLIVNEFCGNGTQTSRDNIYTTTNCIFRDHCYLLHSLDYDNDTILYGNYPMGYCINSRCSNSIWLKLNFIRPEDIKLYNRIGINHFKVTGRTASTNLIIKVTDAYINESYDGNLLDLWKHLETIKDGDNSIFTSPYGLPNKKLEGFVQHWFSNRNHICANEVCGETCTYCDRFFDERITT